MPATAKYDIQIDSKGYTLLQESYRRQAQTPFTPRFSTGDPSAGDLTFWQYIGMEQFNAGIGQGAFDIKSKGWHSSGWITDPLTRELLPSPVPANTGTFFNMVGHANSRGFLPRVRAIPLDGSTVVSAMTGDLSASLTSLTGHVAGKNEIYRVSSPCVEYWSRDLTDLLGGHGVMVGLRDSVAFLNLPDLAAITGSPYSLGIDADSTVMCATQCTIDVFFFATFKPNASGANSSKFRFVKFEDNSFSAVRFEMTYNAGHFVPVRSILDASGHLWILMTERAAATFSAAADEWVTEATARASYLYRFNAGSLDSEPYIDVTVPIPNWIFWDMALLGTDIYLFGGKMNGSKNKMIPAIYRVGFGEVWSIPEELIVSGSLYGTIRGVYSSQSRIVFAAGYIDDTASSAPFTEFSYYALYPGGSVHPIGCLQRSSFLDGPVTGVWESEDDLYAHLKFAADIFVSSPGSFGIASDSNRFWASSYFATDSNLINKRLQDITVELTQAKPAGQSLSVYIQKDRGAWELVSAIATGTTKATFSIAANAFTWRIGFRTSSTDAGDQAGISSFLVKFVPIALKKYQWSLAIRLDLNSKLLDNSYEQLSVATRATNLRSAYRDQTVVTFVDIDGTSYSAIVTDMIERMPLIKEKTNQQEEIVFLELLEV